MAHASDILTLRIGSMDDPVQPPLSPVMAPPWAETSAETKAETKAETSVNPDLLAPTIFHESWWLDVATDHRYSVAEVSSGGKLVGKFPYLLIRRKGLSHIVMPTLTHFLGPALVEGEGSANTRFLRKFNITRELIAKLPPAIAYEIKCHAGVT